MPRERTGAEAIAAFRADLACRLPQTMGAPLNATIIINRCRTEDSFENRSANGTLP